MQVIEQQNQEQFNAKMNKEVVELQDDYCNTSTDSSMNDEEVKEEIKVNVDEQMEGSEEYEEFPQSTVIHPCGHYCNGVDGESRNLPCQNGECMQFA